MIPLMAALLASYLVGSMPTAYLLVKRLTGADIRAMGSGNVGATNVARTIGRGAGAAVFAVDLAKGMVPVLLLAPWLVEGAASTVRLSCGLLAAIGHMCPVWLRGKGGKGVATTIGVLLAAMPSAAAVFLAAWGLGFLLTRTVSVGSILAAASLPIAQWLLRQPAPDLLLGAILAALIIVRHRGNVTRLLQGREPSTRRPDGRG